MIEFLDQFDVGNLLSCLVGGGGVAGIILLMKAISEDRFRRRWHDDSDDSDDQDRFWY